jgi:tape measure domain-containing protein
MAENVGSIYFEVQAKTDKLVNGEKQVDASLNRINKNFDATSANAKRSEMQLTQTAKAVKQVGDEAKAAQSSMGGFGALLAGFASLQGANALIQMAEGYGEMAERIRMATSSAEEYDMVQARLLASANATYRPLKEAQELYILTADSLRSMGYNTEQAIDVVDSMSYAFVKNATSQERAQSAISAFTGAIMTGKLEADGWKTIIAAMPTVINDLAQSTGKSTEEIRKMGAEGKLTASMLSEGLRQSLDQNAQAAQGMATTVKDAFAALNNSLSVYIGEANMANGTTGLLSKSILLFADNLETVVNLLTIAGAGVLAKYIASTTAAAVSAGAAAIAARKQAAEELALAAAHVAAAKAAEAQALANIQLEGGLARLGVASRATAAAQVQLAEASTAARAAGVGLVGVLGGPAGIIALAAAAASAIVLFGDSNAKALPDVNKLREGVDKLSLSMIQQRKIQARDAITQLRTDSVEAAKQVDLLEKQVSRLAQAKANPKELELFQNNLINARVDAEKASTALREMQDAALELSNAEFKITTPQQVTLKNTSDPEVTKRLAAMREELELAKLTGEARARLQAIQKLGANATAEERAEAEKLAAQIFKLEESRKSAGNTAKQSATDRKKAAQEAEKAAEKEFEAYVRNGEKLQEMATQIALLNLEGKELAITQAVLAMGQYATPEQIAAAQALGAALFDAQKRKEQLDAITGAGGVDKFIRGEVSPISGGEFDNQQARYEQEAQIEQERYAGQLERLTAAMELEKVTREQYLATFEQMQQEHSDRMMAIDQARQSVMFSTLSNGMSAMTSALKGAFGEQSGIYKAAFAVQKAASIAQSIVAIQTGIAQAAALPFPANLGAMASVASATASIISTISGTNISGGRQYGGPVAAGSMYRINENGAPEIYKAANGQQYMLPNTRGEVISNADATAGMNQGGAAATINVTLIEDAARGGQVEQTEDNSVRIFVADIRGRGEAAQTLEQTYGLTRRGR